MGKKIEIANSDDMIDVRDIIARVEELGIKRDEYQERDTTEPLTESWAQANEDEAAELATLTALLDKLKD